ncbi:disulfide bond formation protein B [Pseudomonas alkylphenolica]|uniref:Disulfide bond formation protein B n=1 Tax=Pseudomonas alkylphenolica TaxID=237609 RepID=A0A444A027_9PSED|nr:disulfide bond formation protein B [Pseudomonas alkylphenolica]RWU26725.1 disulfide bond formation protein B [Pseudomonas alkylphenolica]
MPLARIRLLFLPALFASVLMLAAAFYLEWGMAQVPCALCYSQRLVLAVFAGVCLCAVVQAPGHRGTRVYAALTLLLAFAGALLAARQVYLQSTSLVPGNSCPAPFGYSVENMPLSELLKTMVVGNPDCVRINWSFLDLTIPEWSLLSFLLLAALSLNQVFGRWRSNFRHRAEK